MLGWIEHHRADFIVALIALAVSVVGFLYALLGGLKVVATSGWFAARPSGTENIYKIYAESFRNEGHLEALVSEAQEMVNDALGTSR